MGLLLKRLNIGNTYWVCELPTSNNPFLEPSKRILTHIGFNKDAAMTAHNYSCTYEFDDIHIHAFINQEVKFHMEMIGKFIISEQSAKMQMVIRNNINPDLYETKVIDKELDIVAIKEYIADVDLNQPQLLI